MKQISKYVVALVAVSALLCVLLLAACSDQKTNKTDDSDDEKDTATTAVSDVTTTVGETTKPTTGTTQKGYADGGVSVRDEAGLGGSNIDTLYDQEITIIDKDGDWYEIEYTDPYGENKTGFVSGDVIEIEGNPNKSEMAQQLPTTTTTTTTTVATSVTTGTGVSGETTGTIAQMGTAGIPNTNIEDDSNW